MGRRRRRSDSLLSLRAEEERGSTFDNSEEKQEKRWCGSRSLEASSQRIAEPRWRQQEKRKKERQSLSELSTKWTTHREVHCWKVSISYYLTDFLSIIALANLYLKIIKKRIFHQADFLSNCMAVNPGYINQENSVCIVCITMYYVK